MPFRAILFLILSIGSLIVGELAIRYQKPAAFHALNEFWLGFSLAATGQDPKAAAVTTIRINEDYEPLALGADEQTSQSSTLTRLDYATILQFLSHLQPAAVGVVPSPVFPETDVFNQTDITPLREVAMRLPKMTAGARLSYSGDGQTPDFAKAPLPIIASTGDLTNVPMVNSLDAPMEPQILANAEAGFTQISNFPVREERNAYLRIPLLAKSERGLLPSFLLVAIAQQRGIPLTEIRADLTESEEKIVSLGAEITIPIESDGSFRLPLVNPFSKEITQVSEGEISDSITVRHPYTSLTATELAYTGRGSETVLQHVAETYASKFESIGENLVLLGFDRSSDQTIAFPNAQQASYLAVLAQAAAVIQSGLHLREVSMPIRVSLFSLFLLAGVCLLQFASKKLFIFSLLLLIVFWSGILITFSETLHWLFPLTPLLISLSLLGCCLIRKKATPPSESITKNEL